MSQSKFPKQELIAEPLHFSVYHGLFDSRSEKPHSTLRNLGRFILPPFQRPAVWKPKQQAKFIESLWLGLPVSVYAYNQSPSIGPTDRWLIDGQQRWNAIHAFVANKVPVFGGLYYRDMTENEYRRFMNTGFPCLLIKSDDEAYLEEMYNRLAYGGTAHEKKGKSNHA